MNTLTTLPTAILQFAYTGVFGPHLRSDRGARGAAAGVDLAAGVPLAPRLTSPASTEDPIRPAGAIRRAFRLPGDPNAS